MNTIRLQIAYATSQRQGEFERDVPLGSTLQEAMALLAGSLQIVLTDGQAVATGVWGRVQPPHYVLREGDRIELYRPLKADPKQARRARIGAQKKK